MAKQAYKFDLKVLTTSREIGLRRLRSYAAAMGSNASIFHSYSELIKSLTGTQRTAACEIVIYDASCLLKADELKELHRLARVFQLRSPDLETSVIPIFSTMEQSEGVFYCSLDALLNSVIARSSLATISRNLELVQIEDLMQWGYSSLHWSDANPQSLATVCSEFVGSLAINRSGRNLLGRFSAFLEKEAEPLGLKHSEATIAADGLTVAIVCQFQVAKEYDLSSVIKILKQYALPTVVINNRVKKPSTLEIAGFVPAEQATLPSPDSLLIVFNKNQFEAPDSILPTLERAG